MAKRSKFFSWSWRDLGHGLLMAVIGSVIGGAQDVFVQGHSINDLTPKTIGGWAIIGGIGYLAKKLGENSDGKLLKKEPTATDTDEILRHQ